MLSRVGEWAVAWGRREKVFTNVYGLARTILALSTAMTLLANGTGVLFRPGSGQMEYPKCSGSGAIGIFCLVPQSSIEWVRWLAILGLLVVASGYRPRFTGILHWWLSLSLNLNAIVLDGGDAVTAVLTLLLVPLTLADRRKWHWDDDDAPTGTTVDDARRILARTTVLLIRVQVAGIYFHAAAAKFGVDEWSDGTALYYFFGSSFVGPSGVVAGLLKPLLANGTTLALMTWSVIVFEFALAAALVMEKRFRGWFLVAGIAFHVAIAVIHGITSFACAMTAALILYLRPFERPFVLVLARAVRARVSALLPATSTFR